MSKKNIRKVFYLRILLFAAYLALLCYFLFFAESMGRTFGERQYHYNLLPFKEINRFWQYRHTLGFMSVALNLAGNVVAFIPFGTFLPGIFVRCRRFFLTTLLSFEFSLCVEIIQLVGKVGSFDVDDILLNTIGGMTGYMIFFIYYRLRHMEKHNSGGKNEKKKSL